MPHAPFLYNQNGQLRDRAAILSTDSSTRAAAYLDYLRFTNFDIKSLVTAIRQQTADSAVIVLMGDHGFRYHGTQDLRPNFQNLNAVYLPGRDYHLFYDSVTCVNQFRLVFNSLFNQSIPLLKDSTIFLAGVP
jgi:arylsulfatase A-like enzyme